MKKPLLFISKRRQQKGASSVETAFLMPVILVSLLLLFEIAHMILIIGIGNLALDKALSDIRDTEGFTLDDSSYIGQSIVENMRINGFGYLDDVPLIPEVVIYENLNMMSTEAEEDDDDEGNDNKIPSPLIISVSVDSQVPFITPLPSMLLMYKQFGYRFHEVTGSLHQKVDDDDA